MRFLVASTGCRSNQYDAMRLRNALLSLGLEEDKRSAEITFLFGCVVTAAAEAKCRRQARNLLRRSNLTYAVGCAGRYWRDFAAPPDGVRTLPERDPATILQSVGLGHVETPLNASVRSERTRYHLKIQEGCPGNCTYCIVPKLRPGSRSKEPKQILPEAEAALDAGYPEIVLTGVHIGLFGRDLSKATTLARMVARLLQLLDPDRHRLRISSIEPLELDDHLLELADGHRRTFAPYFHLPMQSGDTDTLKRMGRPYDADGFRETVETIRGTLPLAGIGLDVITGFPGENEQAFENTLRAIEGTRPVRTHIFPFSARPGTAAFALPDNVPPREKARRAEEAARKAREAAIGFANGFLGKDVEVVWESHEGYSGEYLRCRTAASSPRGLKGIAKVTGVVADDNHPTAVLAVEPESD